LYIVNDIQAGDLITEKHIKAIRPGQGLPTKYLEHIIGKQAKIDLKKGTPLSWDCF
jgi:sialic acid synthase SpsE